MVKLEVSAMQTHTINTHDQEVICCDWDYSAKSQELTLSSCEKSHPGYIFMNFIDMK
jgi:hypothetical protein